MAQYIDKTALVAEIKRREKLVSDPILLGNDLMIGERNALFNLLSFIDTLEVKDVDLEKEINKYISDNFFGSETMGFFAVRTNEEPNDQDMALCAKHFFELGMQQAQK